MLEELEQNWIPMLVKSLPILASMLAIAVYALLANSSFTLVIVASYTNVYVPLEDLYQNHWLVLQSEMAFKDLFKNDRFTCQCPICLEMTCSPAVTRCRHAFHSSCLKKCLEIGGESCPMCRQPIFSS